MRVIGRLQTLVLRDLLKFLPPVTKRSPLLRIQERETIGKEILGERVVDRKRQVSSHHDGSSHVLEGLHEINDKTWPKVLAKRQSYIKQKSETKVVFKDWQDWTYYVDESVNDDHRDEIEVEQKYDNNGNPTGYQKGHDPKDVTDKMDDYAKKVLADLTSQMNTPTEVFKSWKRLDR